MLMQWQLYYTVTLASTRPLYIRQIKKTMEKMSAAVLKNNSGTGLIDLVSSYYLFLQYRYLIRTNPDPVLDG